MSDVFCFTARALCRENFLARIEALAAAHPRAIVLREKDLSEAEYRALAEQVLAICKRHGTVCVLHGFYSVARALECKYLHLPLPALQSLSPKERAGLVLGASCHSPEDAQTAQELGCGYITAGHVFDTDCKKGLPGRGLAFLTQVCRSTTLPVYAIGGISPQNAAAVRRAGAAGLCVMSGAMTCPDPKEYLASLA